MEAVETKEQATEESKGTVSVRKHGGGDLGSMKVDTLINIINKEIEKITKFNN